MMKKLMCLFCTVALIFMSFVSVSAKGIQCDVKFGTPTIVKDGTLFHTVPNGEVDSVDYSAWSTIYVVKVSTKPLHSGSNLCAIQDVKMVTSGYYIMGKEYFYNAYKNIVNGRITDGYLYIQTMSSRNKNVLLNVMVANQTKRYNIRIR